MPKEKGSASLAILFLAALLWVCVTLAGTNAYPAGGDIGGGGMKPKIPKALVLNNDERAALLAEPSAEEAFKAWKENVTETEYQALMAESYKMFVVPQLKDKATKK